MIHNEEHNNLRKNGSNVEHLNKFRNKHAERAERAQELPSYLRPPPPLPPQYHNYHQHHQYENRRKKYRAPSDYYPPSHHHYNPNCFVPVVYVPSSHMGPPQNYYTPYNYHSNRSSNTRSISMMNLMSNTYLEADEYPSEYVSDLYAKYELKPKTARNSKTEREEEQKPYFLNKDYKSKSSMFMFKNDEKNSGPIIIKAMKDVSTCTAVPAPLSKISCSHSSQTVTQNCGTDKNMQTLVKDVTRTLLQLPYMNTKVKTPSEVPKPLEKIAPVSDTKPVSDTRPVSRKRPTPKSPSKPPPVTKTSASATTPRSPSPIAKSKASKIPALSSHKEFIFSHINKNKK